jgi:iron complex outermembrane recepter protein
MRYKSSGLASAALLSIIACQPSFAQDSPSEDSAGEIIVTAQKREEKLQDIPLAVSVVGGTQIDAQGGINLENAQYLVPSLNFRKSGTSLNQALFLRGVGTINFSIAAEPSVAAVLDGVVLSRAGEGFSDLVDVAQIEVLRGPQSTLFGKNASAGIVSITTRRPSEAFEGSAEASFFSKSEYRGRAVLNLPLGDGLRSRFSAFYGEYDGNIRNLTTASRVNGYKHYGVRGVVEADIGDDAMLTFRADWRKANDDCCAESIGTVPTGATASLLGPLAKGDETRNIVQNLVTATKEESWGVSLQADLKLGNHDLVSITSYRNWDNLEIRDGDWVNQPYVGVTQLHDTGPQSSSTFSQEVRIASPADQFLSYVVGGYFSRAKSDRVFQRDDITCSASTLAPIATGLTPCSIGAGVSTIAFPTGRAEFGSVFSNTAIFGQATASVSDRFRIIAGARYTFDKLSVYHSRVTALTGPGIGGNFDAGVFNNGLVGTNANGQPIFIAGPSNGIPYRSKAKQENLSGKVALQYDITDNITEYFSYTRGYKGPAYNIFFNVGTGGAFPIRDETVDSYEFGLKNTLLDGKLILNAAYYYAKYHNYQANVPDILFGQTITRLTNAGTVSTHGIELDMLLRPSRSFSLSGGLAYTDAKVVRFRAIPGQASIPSGTPLANAPKWKGSLAADYKIETGSFANVALGLQASVQSKQLSDFNLNAGVRTAATIGGYSLVDLSAGLVDPDERWALTLQVKNLFDKSFAASIASGGPGGSFRYIVPREADRYFGITAKVNFGGQ